MTDADLIRMMMDIQEDEFKRLGLEFQTLFGRRLQLIDCQNIFCEVAKYARVEYPELTLPGARARIKQNFQPYGSINTPCFPRKWELNETVGLWNRHMESTQSSDLTDYQRRASKTSSYQQSDDTYGLRISLLGLIGEVGEIVSELKKHSREGSIYVGFSFAIN